MMEAEYGIGIKNRFAFLGNEGDNDDENTGAASISILASKASAGKKLDSRNVGKTGVKTTSGVVGQRQVRVVPAENVSKGKNQPATAVKDDKKGAKDNNGSGFVPEKQNHHGPRGVRRDGPPSNMNRRHHRGRVGEDKEDLRDTETKNSANANDASQINGEEANVTTANKDEEKTDGTPEDENASSNVEKTLTLAEWKALQAPREKPVFNIRKPGEGEVASKLEKLVLKKREDLDNHDEEYETDDVYYPQRAGKMKLVSDVGFTTGYQRRRGGRFPPGGTGGTSRTGGGDGNPREGTPSSEQISTHERPREPRGRPRFGPRGGLQRPAQAPRIDDASDFPTLG